jgi:hypothetical protein
LAHWPADQLLRIGRVVAGWFFSRDATSFTVVQMMFAMLVLAAFVALIVCWQRLVVSAVPLETPLIEIPQELRP